jgi:ADP-heptose:LPS heptosyltransferase/GT2 family glycosyltransferase
MTRRPLRETADTKRGAGRNSMPVANPMQDVVDEAAPDVVAESARDIVAESARDIVAESARDIVAESAPDVIAEPASDIVAESVPDTFAGSMPEPIAAPPMPRRDPAIQVEVNAAVEGWQTSSRFDVVLRGQILSTAPVDTFSIQNPAGLELVAVQFGHGDEPDPVPLPGGDVGFQTGFQVYLPMPPGEAVRIADMWVRARGRDGAVFEQGMRLGCMGDQAAILAGPMHDMTDREIATPRAIVYLESAEITPEGQLAVHGWTIATSPIVAVQIFVDGRRVGAAMQGRDRTDVAEVYPSYANARHAGFALERHFDDPVTDTSGVTAQVLCLSGACHSTTIPLSRVAQMPGPPSPDLLAGPPPEQAAARDEPGTAPSPTQDNAAEAPPAAEPAPGAESAPAEFAPGESAPAESAQAERQPAETGWDLNRAILVICDHALVTADGVLLVQGWAACGHGVERISVEIDGKPAGDAVYGRERADVAAEYPGMPVGTGFDFERTIPELLVGQHEIRIITFSRAGDRKDLDVTVTPPASAAFRFELDGPVTRNGVVVHPIAGRLVIEGWALARGGVAGIDVALDGTLLGHAHYGMARPDVGTAFPDWEGSARSGYNFHCPSRALPDGEHLVQVIARSKTGASHVHAFRITVRKTDDPEEAASIRRRIKRVERNTMNGVLEQLDWRPEFHLIVTGHAVDDASGARSRSAKSRAAAEEAARALTIRSIMEQSWTSWRVTVLAADARQTKSVLASIKRLAPKGPTDDHADRFIVIDPSGTAWQAPLAAAPLAAPLAATTARPSLTAVLAFGDELGRDALGCFAVASGLHRDADCFYADEFRLAPGNPRPEAFFKPDFSPALLLATNYIGRPLVQRPALLAATGVTPASLMRDGFHDLALRCTEAAAAVHHVPELLSRTDGGEVPSLTDGAAAVRETLARRGIAAEVSPGLVADTWHPRHTAPVTGKVSIIIPTRAAKGYIGTCLTSLRAMTAYRNFEIVCIDNIPDTEPRWKNFVREQSDKVIEIPPPFNWSRFNNTAAAASDGEYLLFLNDDIEVTRPDWLDAMLEAAAWPSTGIVGARLLYPNRTVQHAGMFLGDGMGRHAFRHSDEADPGYFGLALTRREVIAVTGACLLVRRDTFDQLGRFDEAHDVINNDLDFCLRAHRAGMRTIYTPHATLIHHELSSRDHMPDDFDTTRFTGEWRALFAAGDPYFNPRLSRYSDDYRVDDEGVRVAYGGHPLIDRAAVKAILVVKVDHIGDFITSLPAIRRLKAAFPAARLTALVAPASAAIAAVEPAIDECIPFEFFFERSELGEKELTETELDALTERLAPYRFDIAVDLRKHLSTRHLLRCSGAQVLAGYDSIENFPWLDVVLEWDGDKALVRKRSHIVDDLVNLVAAVDDACEPRRQLFDPAPIAMTAEELPTPARDLFQRPVVAIHPGSGNVMRQWPAKHIPALIDLLIEQDDVAVLLIGGRDDEEKANWIMRQVDRPDRVVSVAGQVPLRELPRLLAACALFIGGNSGPKHIAAASGVPTIGIHSGVVDPGEWGPMGERAVALYRDMSCAPCFLAKPEQCPRGLACVEMLDPALVHQQARMFLARPVERHATPPPRAARRPSEPEDSTPAELAKAAMPATRSMTTAGTTAGRAKHLGHASRTAKPTSPARRSGARSSREHVTSSK